MFCLNCRYNNPNSAKVCYRCGSRLEKRSDTMSATRPYGFAPAKDLNSGMENKTTDVGIGRIKYPVKSPVNDYGHEKTKKFEAEHDEVIRRKADVSRDDGTSYEVPKVGNKGKRGRTIVAAVFIAVAVLATIALPLVLFKSEKTEKLVSNEETSTPEAVSNGYLESLKEKNFEKCIAFVVDYKQPNKEEFKKKWEKISIDSYNIQEPENAVELTEKINSERKDKKLDNINESCMVKVRYTRDENIVEEKMLKMFKDSSGEWKIYEYF